MRGAAAGDDGHDAARPDQAAALVVVIAAIADHVVGAPARSADAAADGRHGIQQRDQLRDVVSVAAGQRDGERDARSIDEEMVFIAWPRTVDRARPRLGAPFLACTWLESTAARDQSIWPDECNLANNSSCRRSHTPAVCHSSNRRQQITPDPNPNSAANAATRSQCATRTRSPTAPPDHPTDCDPDTETAAHAPAAAARSPPKSSSETTHGESIGTVNYAFAANAHVHFILKRVLSGHLCCGAVAVPVP
jgi:hypothetical protein